MERLTPEQIAVVCERETSHDFLHALRFHGYAIVNIDDMRHWWEYYDDAVDPYSLMNWIESQRHVIIPSDEPVHRLAHWQPRTCWACPTPERPSDDCPACYGKGTT